MWSNWSRGQTCAPAEHVRPGTRDELAEAVARGRAVRVAGAGHSFSGGVATDGTLLSLKRLDRVLDVDRASGLVRAEAGISLRRLVRELHRHGLALPNLGDVDAQSLAGALATGTHGTGITLGNLSTAVTGMELVLADGSELAVESGDELLAARVGLGALGVVVAVTLRCVPAFRLHAVDQPRPLEEVLSALDTTVESNDHFELFTFPHSPLALTRTNNRTDAPATPRRPRREWLQDVALDNHAFGLVNRVARRVPRAIPALNRFAGRSASRRERVAESFDVFASPRLVRFEEMEYALPRARAADAVRACREILARHPVSFPIELRFSGGDDALLSPAHGRETAYVAVHVFEGMAFEAPFREVEALLGGWGGRPHWGKRSFLGAEELAPRYPRWRDFAALRERLDPDGRFVNPWTARTLGAAERIAA
ncbi:MAG: L-gulono,4-lactone dehydrogenase [Solirubrobacteraceae bacterium]|jgi:L-gulonolactone oxidase|nr:L-gulono,4-lactone dehydrogenase [Solirubrobacteraceae bacterium]